MNEAIQPKKIVKPITKGVAVIAASFYLSNFAFTRKVRQQIISRDRVCQDNNPHVHRGMLHAAHDDHTKDATYNDPSRGKVMCQQAHLNQHEREEGRNGLTVPQNRFAVKMLANGLASYIKNNR